MNGWNGSVGRIWATTLHGRLDMALAVVGACIGLSVMFLIKLKKPQV